MKKILSVVALLSICLTFSQTHAANQIWDYNNIPRQYLTAETNDIISVRNLPRGAGKYLSVRIEPLSGNPQIQIITNGIRTDLSLANFSMTTSNRPQNIDPDYTVCRGGSDSADILVNGGRIKLIHVGLLRNNQRTSALMTQHRNGPITISVGALQRDPTTFVKYLGQKENFINFSVGNELGLPVLAYSGEQLSRCMSNYRQKSNLDEICAKEFKDDVGSQLCRYFTNDDGFFSRRSSYKAMNVTCQEAGRRGTEVLAINSQLKLENTTAEGDWRSGSCTIKTITCGYIPPAESQQQDGKQSLGCDE